MPETLYYIYPLGKYSTLEEVKNANYEGYEEVYMVPSYNLIAATTPALFIFSAKFKISDELFMQQVVDKVNYICQ